VVRGHGIAQEEQATGVLDALQLGQVTSHALKERRTLDVGGISAPGEELALGHLQGLPVLGAQFDLAWEKKGFL